MDEKEAKQNNFHLKILKANRASETEEQRKERLRIRRKKDRARRRNKKLQEEIKGQKQKTTRKSAWPLSKD